MHEYTDQIIERAADEYDNESRQSRYLYAIVDDMNQSGVRRMTADAFLVKYGVRAGQMIAGALVE